MRILLFETTAYYPSSPLFLEALVRLSEESAGQVRHTFVDEARFRHTSSTVLTGAARRILRRPSVNVKGLNSEILRQARSFRPDVCLIAKGAFLTPDTLARIKSETGAIMVNYATDDPFNTRVSTAYMRAAIPFYDVYACTKLAIMDDVAKAGCPSVAYVPFGYKPEVHFPERAATETERCKFQSDVAFIGGCDNDRAPIFLALAKGDPGVEPGPIRGTMEPLAKPCAPIGGDSLTGRDFRLAVSGAA